MEGNKDFATFVQEQINEIDIELKAVCYDITTGNKNAISSVERVRRKMKIIQKRADVYKKDLNSNKAEMKRLVKSEENLKKENATLKEELGKVKQDLKDLQDFESFVSEVDTSMIDSSQPPTSSQATETDIIAPSQEEQASVSSQEAESK